MPVHWREIPCGDCRVGFAVTPASNKSCNNCCVVHLSEFARKIKGLTAMGRASAYVLIGLPFFVALALTLLNPSYMHPLYATSTGHTLIMVGLMMMAFGSS